MIRQIFDPGRKRLNTGSYKPTVQRYRCAAEGCPLVGAIVPGNADSAVCAWHYDAKPGEWPEVTQRIQQWRPVVDAINESRRVLVNPQTCVDVAAQNSAVMTTWAHMQRDLAPEWHSRVQPTMGESLGHWVRRLEAFLGAAMHGKPEAV